MTTPAALCGLLVALAVLVALPGRVAPPVRRARLRAAARGRRAAAGPAHPVRSPRRARWPRRRPEPLPTTAEVALLADQVAALARAGLPPGRIWPAVAEHGPSPPVRAVAGAVVAGRRQGFTAAEVLRVRAAGPGAARPPGRTARRTPGWSRRRVVGRASDGRADGSGGLAHLALALEVSERTGAGLSQTLGRLADALRAEEQAADELRGALAGPTATASLLTFLPLGGLVLATALGSRPWRVLLVTAPGRLCLLTGGALWLAGRLWARSLVRRAEGTR